MVKVVGVGNGGRDRGGSRMMKKFGRGVAEIDRRH